MAGGCRSGFAGQRGFAPALRHIEECANPMYACAYKRNRCWRATGVETFARAATRRDCPQLSQGRTTGGCTRTYVGAARACGDPKIAVYSASDASALTVWRIDVTPSPPPPSVWRPPPKVQPVRTNLPPAVKPSQPPPRRALPPARTPAASPPPSPDL